MRVLGCLGCVALRKESVDRNGYEPIADHGTELVALRKESVDRNIELSSDDFEGVPSLSARRAWIEIALLMQYLDGYRGRSPQGERG